MIFPRMCKARLNIMIENWLFYIYIYVTQRAYTKKRKELQREGKNPFNAQATCHMSHAGATPSSSYPRTMKDGMPSIEIGYSSQLQCLYFLSFLDKGSAGGSACKK